MTELELLPLGNVATAIASNIPFIQIRRLSTKNQRGENAQVFHPFNDALALIMDCYASPSLLSLPGASFRAYFQIINLSTNKVVVNHIWGGELKWGEYFWISSGNNWSTPYDTPDLWGIHPAAHGWPDRRQHNTIFGFRGAIEANSWRGEAGLEELGVFDVSPIRWFRVRRVARL